MDGITPELLRSFLAACERGHVGRAARELGISQPALSRRIDRLEALDGAPLLVRSSRETRTTPAGAELCRQAPELLAALEGAVVSVRAVANGIVGELRMQASGCGTADFVPTLVDEFAAAHPGCRTVLARGRSDDAVAALADGDADVAFVHLPVTGRPTITARTVVVDRWLAVVPNTHRLAALDALPANAFAGDEPVVLFPRESTRVYDRLIDHVFGGRDDNAVVPAGVTDELSMLLVAQRRGLPTVVSGARARTTRLAGMQVLPFAGGGPDITLGVAWRPDRRDVLVDAFVTHALRAAQPGAT